MSDIKYIEPQQEATLYDDVERYGSGWGAEKLKHCVRSAYTFSEEEIVYATRTQLTWTHLRTLMGIKDPLERQFYAQMCSSEHWDTRTLDDKIDKQLYLQTALSRKPEEVIKKELAEHEGQMRLYLRYLNQNDRKPWEESPIGLILCSEGNTEHVEYLMLDEESPIKVAQYYTKLPDKKLLSEKLRKAIAIAREHYNERKEDEA